MRLSDHFELSEFTHSQTAARLGIDNTPPPAILEELRRTAARMEKVRSMLGVPIIISSGYRCEALEKEICRSAFERWCARSNVPANDRSWSQYLSRKAHPQGRAVDFCAPRFGSPLKICEKLAKHAQELQFDQLIHEFRSWAHIGWPASNVVARLDRLTIDDAGTRTGFA